MTYLLGECFKSETAVWGYPYIRLHGYHRGAKADFCARSLARPDGGASWLCHFHPRGMDFAVDDSSVGYGQSEQEAFKDAFERAYG